MKRFKSSLIYKEYQDIKQRKKYLKSVLKRYSRNGIILFILFLIVYSFKYQEPKVIGNIFKYIVKIGYQAILSIKNISLLIYNYVQDFLINGGIFNLIVFLLIFIIGILFIKIRRRVNIKETVKVQDYVNYNLEEIMAVSFKYLVIWVTTLGLILISYLMMLIDKPSSIILILIVFLRLLIVIRVIKLGFFNLGYYRFIKNVKKPKKVDIQS